MRSGKNVSSIIFAFMVFTRYLWSSKRMKYAHIVNSERGGLGKTTFCCLLFEYFQAKNIPIELIDTDRTNPNVGRRYFSKEYSGYAPIFFSDNQDETTIADEIYEKAFKGDILVNLPSQIMVTLNNWFTNQQVLQMAKSDEIQFVNWFLTDGGIDSLELFEEFVETHKDNMIHVLVKNGRFSRKWDFLQQYESLNKLIQFHDIESIQIPSLETSDMNLIKKYNLSFQSACESSELKVMSRQRVRLFMGESFRNIHKTNVMTSILDRIRKKSASVLNKDSSSQSENTENNDSQNAAEANEIENISYPRTDFDDDFVPA